MQSGQYIIDRWIVSMIREICVARGIEFKSYSDDWLLELTKSGKTARILGYKFSLNDAVASAIAQDKVAAYQILADLDIPAIPHYLLRTKVGASQRQTLNLPNRLVVKPLMGTSGHEVHLVSTMAQANEIMSSSGTEAWAVSPFVDIKRELRFVMLDGHVLIAYEKRPVVIEGLKMFNLGKGATALDIVPTPAQITLAQAAQATLGLRLSAVDVVELKDGQELVLEVNEGIMMENYARQSEESKRRSKDVYAAIIEAVMAP